MHPISRLIAFLAPDNCIICNSEGDLLCEACLSSELVEPVSQCYRCSKLTTNFETCRSCRTKSPLRNVWVATAYDDLAKRLIQLYKFDSRRGAVDSISTLMAEKLPRDLGKVIVTNVPTSPSRVRSRGFDHTSLLGKTIARALDLTHSSLLWRTTNVHQVGATRAERLRQIQGIFRPQKQYMIKDSVILLVDDVMTTGASLEEAAKVLRKAGARRIYAVVFAH